MQYISGTTGGCQIAQVAAREGVPEKMVGEGVCVIEGEERSDGGMVRVKEYSSKWDKS